MRSRHKCTNSEFDHNPMLLATGVFWDGSRLFFLTSAQASQNQCAHSRRARLPCCMSEEWEDSYAAWFVGGIARPCTRLAAYCITACLLVCMASSSPMASFSTLLALLARARCMSEESEVSYAARFVGGRPRLCTRLAAYSSITACLTLCMASSSPTASFSTFLALHTCVFCKTCKLSESKQTASSLHNFGKSSPNCLIKKLCMGFGSKAHCKDSRRSRCRTCPSISSGRKNPKKQRLKASVHTGYFSRRAFHQALVATWKQEQRLVVSSMRYEFFCLLPLLPPGKVQATSQIAVRKSFTNATQSSEGICRCTALSSASGTCPLAIASRTALPLPICRFRRTESTSTSTTQPGNSSSGVRPHRKNLQLSFV